MSTHDSDDTIVLDGIAFLDIWVNDARSVADSYAQFGFRTVAEGGPETGLVGHRSIIVKHGAAILLITSSIDDTGPVAEFTRLHGDGVRDIAFAVCDVDAVFHAAMDRGASAVRQPHYWGLSGSTVRRATIAAFGDVVHSFVHVSPATGPSFPSLYRPVTPLISTQEVFDGVDHIAMCLEAGTMGGVAEYYKRVLGFQDGQAEYITTERSGMNARVVHRGPLRFPLQEPLRPHPSGPIADFLRLNRGPGVYHIGLLTRDIVRALRSLGPAARPLPTPPRYYDALPARVGAIDEPLEELRELSILVDREASGYLLQVFTPSLHERETLFFEAIQRKGGANSFGSGNVRALFEAVESDRIARTGAQDRG